MTNIEPSDFPTEMLLTFSLWSSLYFCLIAITEKTGLMTYSSVVPLDRASSVIHSTSQEQKHKHVAPQG